MVRNSAKQAGNADDDAIIEREAVDLVLEGLRLPQIELRQIRAGHLGDQRHRGAGIEGDEEDVGIGRALALRAEALAGGDVDDAPIAEIRPEHAGADHAVVRRDDQPVDLFVGVVGEREHRPLAAVRARRHGAHLDAAHDAVGARRGRDLDAVIVAVVAFDRRGEIDHQRVEPDRDRLHRTRRRRRQRCRESERKHERSRTRLPEGGHERGQRAGKETTHDAQQTPRKLARNGLTPFPGRDAPR